MSQDILVAFGLILRGTSYSFRYRDDSAENPLLYFPWRSSAIPRTLPTIPLPSSCKLERVLVIARLDAAGVRVGQAGIAGFGNCHLNVVDDPSAELQVPKNKGHEAMVYPTTYIVDHHDILPDVIFAHPDRITWHNNDLLDSDLVKLIRRLIANRAKREGVYDEHAVPSTSAWVRR
jgi:Protein of unknown function (DUF3431)